MVKCRGCSIPLTQTFLNLGPSPIANDLISPKNLVLPEVYYPLQAMVCMACCLVQLPEAASRESIFRSDYVYFSSYSSSWLHHSRSYVSKMLDLLNLSDDDLVIEVASNDGYLLQYFKEHGVKVLGVEPSSGVAKVAIAKGIPTVVDFFGAEIAAKLVAKQRPKLMVGNNVLAHVPDLHDFIAGFALLIAENGLITFEFPHLLNLIRENQFDTIYHEHFSYLSLTALIPIFESEGLKIIDVEKLSTHGGSIRIFVAQEDSNWNIEESVLSVLNEESLFDPRSEYIQQSLRERTLRVKMELLDELINCKKRGFKVAAYGAAAKGNTLLNYSGIDSDLVEYIVDLNPHKQGNYLPGSRIPIVGLEELVTKTPDVLLILPWNLAIEIKEELKSFHEKGVQFLRAIPNLEYF